MSLAYYALKLLDVSQLLRCLGLWRYSTLASCTVSTGLFFFQPTRNVDFAGSTASGIESRKQWRAVSTRSGAIKVPVHEPVRVAVPTLSTDSIQPTASRGSSAPFFTESRVPPAIMSTPGSARCVTAEMRAW